LGGELTALRVQQKNRERVSVYLDGRFAFGVPALVAARLKVGQFLSDEDIESLKERGDLEQAYNSALNYLSYRPRSRSELGSYLRRQGAADKQIDAILERLEQAGLSGDEAFAKYWVENRDQFRPRGPAALRHELRAKGIDTRVINGALECLDSGDGAYRASARKAQQLRGMDRVLFTRKIVEFLARRGFEYDIARETAMRHWTELSEDA
jgi:regulatory protein